MTLPAAWLELHERDAPLVVCFPHTGIELPQDLQARFVSAWLARKDADHWLHLLYSAAAELGATTLRTRISRSVIDVNRDPSGASLYPGQLTTELCPLTTFEGEALYVSGQAPDAAEIEARCTRYFAPYHDALTAQISRLRARHACVVVYDAHSIRSQLPRLFSGVLPHLNLGTNDGASCARALAQVIEHCCAQSNLSWVSNGRFKGGWTTRHYGRPAQGVHALQLELACRSYLSEPGVASEANWPPAYDPVLAAPLQPSLAEILKQCLAFARSSARSDS